MKSIICDICSKSHIEQHIEWVWDDGGIFDVCLDCDHILNSVKMLKLNAKDNVK